MKTRIAVAVAAVVLGVAAPVSSAMAFNDAPSFGRYAAAPLTRGAGPVASHDHPRFVGCPLSSASEGNANQQNFPVKQYGQTSGGHRC